MDIITDMDTIMDMGTDMGNNNQSTIINKHFKEYVMLCLSKYE